MAESKIDVKIGEITLAVEGEAGWVSDQFRDLLQKLPELAEFAAKIEPSESTAKAKMESSQQVPKALGALASYLASKSATTNQVRKFLATSIWLHDREGKDRLATRDVSKALSDAHQSRLTNAAECLNQNVAKGFCEKSGKDFFVTPEGRTEIG